MATRERQVEAQQRIGRAINVWATIRGISKAELAKRVGMSRQSFYERLRGDATLGIAEVELIAEVLNVSVGDLLEPPAEWGSEQAGRNLVWSNGRAA